MVRRGFITLGVALILLPAGLSSMRGYLPAQLERRILALPLTNSVLNLLAYRSGEAIRDGGPAEKAVLNDPAGLYLDARGDLYISDRRHHRIRRVSDGVISTFAGTGKRGYSGDGIPASASRLNFPNGLAGDGRGNLFVADTRNNRIRRISADGVITTVAGTGAPGFQGDGGPAVSAQLRGPFDVCVSQHGVLFLADTENHLIRRIGPDGLITTVAGTGEPGYSGDGGPARLAALDTPYGVSLDAKGNLYVADSENHRIRMISIDGRISTIAGIGEPGYGGDGGPATRARLNSPQSVFVTANGEIYVADEHNQRVRKISADGTISTAAGDGRADFAGDHGSALEASLADPESIWVAPSGSLLVADGDNQRIRRVDADQVITTIVGGG